MMLSHPVLLGFAWSLLLSVSSGQSQISNEDSHKVYSYTYHFQHNGTTNSKEILQSVLGNSGFGDEPPDGQSIVKTFSNPNIRGFFTKGVLPSRPLNSYNAGFGSRFNSNPGIDGIKEIVQRNLQPPSSDVLTGLLPVSPDIAKEFPGDFNNVNHLGNTFQNQDDFPKIPPPPPPPTINNNNNNNNNLVSRVQTFSRDTPDGGKVVGKIESFAYNPPPVTNSVSNFQENSQGYRRNENIVDNNQGVTGHRTQSYFRQQFRTVTPNANIGVINNLHQNNRVDNNNNNNNLGGITNNNNQWWNVLGGNNDRGVNQQINHNVEQHRPANQQVNNNVNNRLNNEFGRRLNNLRNVNHNNQNNFNVQNNRYGNNGNRGHNQPANNNNYNNQANNNFNNPASNSFNNQGNNNYNNQVNSYNNQANGNFNNQANRILDPAINNNAYNNPVINSNNFRNQRSSNEFNNQGNNNFQNQFNNDNTAKKVLNLINDVNSHLNNVNQRVNNVGLTWDDNSGNVNEDWSIRHPNGRPFSNAHSGPLNNPVGPEILKTTLEALVGGREIKIPKIADIGRHGSNYRNQGGGGIEKFFGVDRVIEGPNSFSRNQQRGYERNFEVNSNSGYQRDNQWSTNTLRRLDAQSTKSDFSKDFIDVFRDDY